MSATDDFRSLLNEHGVEWIGTIFTEPTNGHPTNTSLGSEHHDAVFIEYHDGNALRLFDLTPEQAIEATLGRGECELIHTRDKPRSKALTLTCSECGWWTDRINDEWKYCPRCGKRVKA